MAYKIQLHKDKWKLVSWPGPNSHKKLKISVWIIKTQDYFWKKKRPKWSVDFWQLWSFHWEFWQKVPPHQHCLSLGEGRLHKENCKWWRWGKTGVLLEPESSWRRLSFGLLGLVQFEKCHLKKSGTFHIIIKKNFNSI